MANKLSGHLSRHYVSAEFSSCDLDNLLGCSRTHSHGPSSVQAHAGDTLPLGFGMMRHSFSLISNHSNPGAINSKSSIDVAFGYIGWELSMLTPGHT